MAGAAGFVFFLFWLSFCSLFCGGGAPYPLCRSVTAPRSVHIRFGAILFGPVSQSFRRRGLKGSWLLSVWFGLSSPRQRLTPSLPPHIAPWNELTTQEAEIDALLEEYKAALLRLYYRYRCALVCVSCSFRACLVPVRLLSLRRVLLYK